MDINQIIEKLLQNFDISYMLTVIALTYILIKIFDKLNKEKPVKTIYKRVTLMISIIIISIIYIICGYENKIALLNSAILSPLMWNYVIKPIFKFLNIDYKSIDNYMN